MTIVLTFSHRSSAASEQSYNCKVTSTDDRKQHLSASTLHNMHVGLSLRCSIKTTVSGCLCIWGVFFRVLANWPFVAKQ